jgi:carboxylate-amine ligase
MMQPTFRGSPRPTIGVELELQLVNAESLALENGIFELLGDLPTKLQDYVKPEFFQCYAEINTEVCQSVSAMEADLGQKIRAVEESAERQGLRLAWAGTHPFSDWRDQAITPNSRYLALAERLQETVTRPVTFGLHVHVGVSSGDGAVLIINRLRSYLPILLALSANSPFWSGRATGLHAHRLELLEGFPTGGLPPTLRSWCDYTSLVETLVERGFIQNEKEIWWDLRPNAENGTIEIRICDMPADLTAVVALVALCQCLVYELEVSGEVDAEYDRHSLTFLRQDRWRAARYGLGAELIDPMTGRGMPVRRLATELVARLGSAAADLDCRSALEQVFELARRPSGAECQLASFHETGDLSDVVRRMVDRSALVACTVGVG